MKKVLFLFVLTVIFISFSGVKPASAQLEYYHFAFNIYDNDVRTIDTTQFKITMESFERSEPTKSVFLHSIYPASNGSHLGYDYGFFTTSLLFRHIVNLNITKNDETMTIIFDYPKASAWSTVGIDKVQFKNGVFRLTEKDWPTNKKVRPTNEGYFSYLDENFDWEKIRE